MTTYLPAKQYLTLFALATVLFISSSAFGSATIVVRNDDAANVGFNDNTPVSPVGGNTGVTLGQQRLIAAQRAADIWGQVLNSTVTTVIGATWSTSMPCGETSGTLAFAGSHSGTRNFPNSIPNTWYAFALANALSGSDRNGGIVDIDAEFNLRLGTAGCLSDTFWYYGLDNNHGLGIDLVTVALHEFGHGLGFASFTDETNGVQPGGFPSVYDLFLRDNTTGKLWPNMTDAERKASATNVGNLVWTGSHVTASVPSVLSFGFDTSNRARLYAPNPVKAGSSVSHFDTVLAPNQLMEPNISNNLTHSVTVPQDLTLALLMDLGWNNGPPPSPTPTPPAPPNDNFANAQVLTGCAPSATGTNIGATREAGEKNHSPDGMGSTHSVWYQWQAPVNFTVRIDTIGSNFDTVLGVYTGSSVNNLATVIQNDDINPGVVQTSRVEFSAVAGTLYKIAVDGWDGGDDVGPVKVNLTPQSPCTISSTTPQILLEESGPVSDQAAIFDSVLHLRDPFIVFNSNNLFNPVSDPNTRVVIFVSNLPGTSVVVNVIDSNNNSFDLTAEDVHQFTEFEFNQVAFRLPNGLASGTCRIRVFSQGLVSNTATFRIL